MHERSFTVPSSPRGTIGARARLALVAMTAASALACGEPLLEAWRQSASDGCRSATVLASSGLSLRLGASTSHRRIGSVAVGSTLCVLQEVNGGLYAAEEVSNNRWAEVQGPFSYQDDSGGSTTAPTAWVAAPPEWLRIAGAPVSEPPIVPPGGTGSAPAATFGTCHGYHPADTLPGSAHNLYLLLQPGTDFALADYLVPVNVYRGLPATYAPPELEWIPADLLEGGASYVGQHDLRLRRRALGALRAWSQYCGGKVKVKSDPNNIYTAYRSWDTQCHLRNFYANVTYTKAAFPGFSEHHLGTTADVINNTDSCVKEQAHRFGFVQSYPAGTVAYHGYITEGWHYRYVGRSAASEHHDRVAAAGRAISAHELLDRLAQEGRLAAFEAKLDQDACFDTDACPAP